MPARTVMSDGCDRCRSDTHETEYIRRKQMRNAKRGTSALSHGIDEALEYMKAAGPRTAAYARCVLHVLDTDSLGRDNDAAIHPKRAGRRCVAGLFRWPLVGNGDPYLPSPVCLSWACCQTWSIEHDAMPQWHGFMLGAAFVRSTGAGDLAGDGGGVVTGCRFRHAAAIGSAA